MGTVRRGWRSPPWNPRRLVSRCGSPGTEDEGLSISKGSQQQHLIAWRNSIHVIFALAGVGLSTWVSRVPAVRDHLHASTGEMGFLILGLSVGSIVGLLFSSQILARFGPRATILLMLGLAAASLVVIGAGATFAASFGLVFAGLVAYGLGSGICNVAMNVEAAAIERALGRSIMPLFHAAFSVGGVAGAGLGAVASFLSINVALHLGIIGLVIVAAAVVAVRFFQPHPLPPGHATIGTASAPPRARFAVWLEPRTLLIGVLVLGMSFAGGSANDWIALAMVDGHGVGNSMGAVVVGVFVVATTIGRIGGASLLDRFGRVPVLRGSALVAVIGLIIFIFVPNPVAATVGVVFWGLGAALGFPVGMSAAADDPVGAPARISAVATIGYAAFLVGPPVIGVLGEHVGLLDALLVVLVFLVAAGLVSPAARERATEFAQAPSAD